MSSPRRVIRRREYPRMTDGKDVDFVFALDEIAGE